MDDLNKRLAILEITTDLFAKILGRSAAWHHYEVVSGVIPEDAIVVNTMMDFRRNNIQFLLRSKEFAVVQEGGHIPSIAPMLRQVDCPVARERVLQAEIERIQKSTEMTLEQKRMANFAKSEQASIEMQNSPKFREFL